MSDLPEKLSFTSFWRRGKAKLKKGSSGDESVDSDRTPSDAPTSDKKSAASKSQSQARRAQVRSAQIRHRQRKADYQKQLELDISEYRRVIAEAEAETAVLRRQNASIVSKLREAGIDESRFPNLNTKDSDSTPTGPVPDWVVEPMDTTTSMSMTDNHHSTVTTSELFGNLDLANLTVTLGMNESLGAPSLMVNSTSTSGSMYSSSNPDDSALTPAQESAVINFILALEHVCWNHFMPGDFSHHYHDPDQDVPFHGEHGHALLASTYCMNNAPDSIYTDRRALGADPSPENPSPSPSSSDVSSLPTFSWESPGLSITYLRGLASSLNPGDKELTPVQAWFELAERYNPVSLIEGGALDILKREFKGVVKCLAYGAVIEREAFENVVGRVMHQFVAI